MNNGKHGQGTHSIKMGAYSSAENTPKSICPICLPKPKNLGFQRKKRHHWASVISVPNHGHISRVFSDSDVTKCAVCSNVQVVVNTKFKTKCSDDDTIILIIFSIPTTYQFFKFQALHMSQNSSYYYYMKQIWIISSPYRKIQIAKSWQE